VLCYTCTYINKSFAGHSLWLRLSLHRDFPQAFAGIACVLPSYFFALILSDPAHAALANTLAYPTPS